MTVIEKISEDKVTLGGYHQFGDVVNSAGDILVRMDPSNSHIAGIMSSGVVKVTLKQALAAKAHGWIAVIGTGKDGLVEISR